MSGISVPAGITAKYEIRGTLGAGAMGVVYDAWDRLIERRVAIKVVRRPADGDPEAVEAHARFRREAQAAGRLQHPNIVAVYDYGEDDSSAWIVMELVEGGSLKKPLDRNERMPIPEIVRVMSQVLEALDYSHRRGVVHRDIKPANVMLGDGGQAKLADFGIARIENSSMTQVGTVMGTPSYMAPEQLRGETVDLRADIWASGVLLYQLLTGEKPFEGGFAAVMHKALNTEPTPPSQISVTCPPAFDAVIARALAKRPSDRFASAAAFAEAIRAAATGQAPALLPLADADATMVTTRRAPAAAPAQAPAAAPAPATTDRKASPILLVAGVALAAGVIGGVVMFSGLLDRGGPPPAPQLAAVTPAAQPTTSPQSQPPAPSPGPAVQPPAQVALQPPSPQPAAAPSPGPVPQPPAQAVLPPPSPQPAPAPSPGPAVTAPLLPMTPPAPQPRPAPAPEPDAKPSAGGPAQPTPQPVPQQSQQAPAPQVSAPAPTPQPAPAQATPPPQQRPQPPAAPLLLRPADPAPPQQLALVVPRLDYRAAANAAVAAAPCSLIAASASDSGLVLAGVVQRAQEAAVRSALSTGNIPPGDPALRIALQPFDGPYCPVLPVLRAALAGPAEAPQVAVDGTMPLRRGQLLRFGVTMPPWPAHLYVAYFMKSGEVAHLVPSAQHPAGARVRLGDPAPGFPGWEIDEPFGTDLMVVIASEQPLFPGRRPFLEAQDAYLGALAAALDGARRQGLRVLLRPVVIETVDR